MISREREYEYVKIRFIKDDDTDKMEMCFFCKEDVKIILKAQQVVQKLTFPEIHYSEVFICKW